MKSILFVLSIALLCKRGSFHKVYFKNDIDLTSYPSVGNKFQRPVLDGVPWKSLENSIFKSRANNLKDVFRYSVDTIKMKSKQVDIIFLIDSSSSIGKVNFHSEINFVKKLLSHFDLSFNYTRIALITFSSHTKVVRHIDQISSPNEDHDQCSAVTNDIPRIEFVGGGTYTYGALKEAQIIFSTARVKSRKYIFLVTDGFSNGRNPISIAEDLKSNNVTIFTIGIQSGNYAELYNISSYPKETHSFLLDSFKQFEKLARGALIQDHKLGYSIKLVNSDRCNILCGDDSSHHHSNQTSSCCNALASCECRIPSGHYSCTCPKGYVGEGLDQDCLPCLRNTYWINSAMCMPCPDINHVTLISPALSVKDCICKTGFKRTADDRCEGITCPKLSPPENGYFVAQPDSCSNVFNAACGTRCKSGYQLTGSSLRLCQMNGTWSGMEAKCVLKSCPSLAVPLNGMITCQNHDLELPSYDYSTQNETFMETYSDETKRHTEPMPIDTECTYRCGPGNYLVGSRNRNCLPLSKWDGRQTTCKTVLCAPLPKPKFGSYEPPLCTKSKQSFGTNCTLICPEGFTLKGADTRTCAGKKNGLWMPKNKNSKCVDVTPPKLVCPDNYTLELPADSDTIVLLSLPLPLEVQDSSTSSVTIWTKPSVDETTGVRLKTGHHTFTYFASDKFNNKAECLFRVTVIDTTPPTVENCVDPEEFWISRDGVVPPIEWQEPIFADNSNEPVVVKVLTVLDPRRAHSLVAGDYPVLYSAKDRWQNSNECLLNVTVKELSCDPLSAPRHGLSYCARNATHTWCEITCDYGHAIFDDETGEYLDNFRLSCDHKHPKWKYLTVPDCTKLDLPESIGQTFTITLDSANPLCSSQSSRNNLIFSLSDQMKSYLCSDLTDCDVISEIPECIQEQDDDMSLGDREKYHISKREAPSSVNLAKKNRKRVRSNVRIRLYTKISKRLGLWQKNATLSENIRQMKYQVQRLDINEPLKRVLQDMQIDVRRLKVEDFVRCPDGSISKKNICVQCPRGTYQDAALNRCKLCQLGSYNPDSGRLMCIRCPQHHSTRREGRLHKTDCKAQCPPGTFAKMRPAQRRVRPGLTLPHSLMPFCRKCAVGEYQPAYDQTSCQPCPVQLHSPRGSTSIHDCTQQRPHICDVQPICGAFGRCVPELGGDDLYSCTCSAGYLGAQCEQRIDPCHSAPCYNNGACSSYNETTVVCHCPREFTGTYCEDLRSSCDVTECRNGGTCISSEDGAAACECPVGFEGRHCEESMNYCDSKPCETGICHNQINGYSCQCPPGVIGRRCHLRPCDNFPCHRNAFCMDVMAFPATRESYQCKCPTGLAGHDCDEIANPCDESPCKNNAICKPVALRQVGVNKSNGVHSNLVDDDVYAKFTCTCPPYFYGDLCEVFTKPDFVMKFHKASTLNYVEMKGPHHDMSELSFCTWIKTHDIFTYGSVLSYATKDHDNAFTLTDYSGFILYVNGNSSGSDIVANDGEWHFICVSWTSENGYYEIYYDGRMEHVGMNLSAGEHIAGRGIFIIGQEQDKLGGGFSESESFIGQIAYLDVWDTFLSGEQVHGFYTKCDPYRGTLYSWTDFKTKIRGDIEILTSNFCQECPRNLHIPNGSVRYVGNTALYECNTGYNLRGMTAVRYCLRTSRWSPGVPYCEMVNCGEIPMVENGLIEYSSGTTLHSMAQYICNTGFAVDGNDKRICLAMGVWSGVDSVCRSSVQCEHLILPANIKAIYASDKGLIPNDLEYYPVGVYAELTCQETLKDYFLTCMDDGRWDVPIPECLPLSTTELPSTTPSAQDTTTTPTMKQMTLGWSLPEEAPANNLEASSTLDESTLPKTTTETPKEEDLPTPMIMSNAEFQTSAPIELSSVMENEPNAFTTLSKQHTLSTTTPVQLQPQNTAFPYPDKNFWSLLHEFLLKGCLDEGSTEITLCALKVKPVSFINLLNYDQNNLEQFPNPDVQLLDLLELHSTDIVNQSIDGIPFEDFFDMLLYGKDFANAQRMSPDLENALRFTLCIFIDAIAFESKFDHVEPVEDGTAMENRSAVLKKLIRHLVGPVYANGRTRFIIGKDQPSTTDFATVMRTRRNALDDDESLKSYYDASLDENWLASGERFEEPKGCDLGGLPDPPLDGTIKQLWESETVDFGTEVVYGCGPNYEPNGRSWVSVCLTNGLWSEVDYSCQLTWCHAPPTLPNMIVDSPLQRYHVGIVVRLKCDRGFELTNTDNTIECLGNGTWSRVLRWCTRITCGQPILPHDAGIQRGNSYLYGAKVAIDCGRKRIVEITCGSERKWAPNPQTIC